MADKIEFVVTAKNATKSTFDEITASLGNVDALLGKIGGTVASALSVGALAAFTARLGDMADELDNASLLLGVSAQTLREWQYVAELSNISGDQFVSLLEKLSRSAGEAAGGNKQLIESFAKLGITQEDLKGDLAEIDNLFLAVVEGLRSMGNTYEQVSVSQEVFSRLGIQMLGWVRSAPEDINAAIASFRQFAGVMSDEQVKAVADAKDAWDALLTLLEQRALTTLGPIVVEANRLAQAMAQADMVRAEQQIRELSNELVNLEARLRDFESERQPENKSWLFRVLDLLPGGPIDEDALRARLVEVRAKIAELQATLPPPPPTGGGGGSAPVSPFPQLESIEEEIDRERTLNMELALLDQMRTEQEAAWAAERIALAQAEAEAKAATDAASTENARREAEARAEFEKKIEKQKQLAAAQGALQRFAIAAQGHKKLFELGKAAAIADAIVNTYKAVQAARAAAPPPLNYALAAIELAAGAANVAAIQGASFGGGGATVQASGPGGYAPALPQPPANAVAPGQQQQGQTITLVVETSDPLARAFFESTKAYINDRDEVLIGANSRQYAELTSP